MTNTTSLSEAVNLHPEILFYMWCGVILIYICLKIIFERYNSNNSENKKFNPIKYPDNMGLKRYKGRIYVIKNKKRKYLTKEELTNLYKKYSNTLRDSSQEYPTRVIQIIKKQ